jgi:DNA-binding MarR family transcriptional regulator
MVPERAGFVKGQIVPAQRPPTSPLRRCGQGATFGVSGPSTCHRPRYAPFVTAVHDPATDRRWLDPEEQDVWRRLLCVHSRLIQRLDEELRETHDLSLADYDVLVVLAEAPAGALRMRQLAGSVMLSPSGLTRRVDRLVARGLVIRRLCPSDGRGALATLTERGRRLLADAAPTHVAGVRSHLLDPLGPAALQGLARSLDAIATSLDAHDAGPAPAGGGRLERSPRPPLDR